jgi:drug/metabolite transporter (DMT)-like permease
MLLVQCFAAPFAALMEWAWLGTHLTMSQAISSLVILLGVALAIAPSDHVEIPRRTLVIGVLFGLLAAAGQAGGAVISRSGFRIAAAAGQDVDGIAAAYQRILGGVAMALIAVILIKSKTAIAPSRTPREKWGRIWRWVIVNGLSGPALGVSCYQWALKSTPTGIVLPIVATTPIVIIPFAWFVEGERPSLRSILGAVVAISGAVALVLLR